MDLQLEYYFHYHNVICNGKWRLNEFESGGRAHLARSAGNFFCAMPLHFFGYTSTISRDGERFLDGQYSLVSLLFAVFLNTV